MNVALILSGGIGSRMKMNDYPKQYLMVRDQPVIHYSLRTFQDHEQIDHIVIVAAEPWRAFIDQWIQNGSITKFAGYADPGASRQLSIYNGLKVIEERLPEATQVIIHDAARPLLPAELVSTCMEALQEADGVMPVLPMKDTCYQSTDGMYVDGFLPRSQLFAGQAPEAFRFRPYLQLHKAATEEYLNQISGSSELAYKNGMKIRLVEGSEKNIKITTRDDLLLLEKILDGEK